MRTTWTFHSANCLLFGRDAVAQLGERLRPTGAGRALIVTDATLHRLGLADRVAGIMTRAGIASDIYAGCIAEAPLHTVAAAVEAGRQCRSNVIVGLGGGSNMDVAKMAAVILAHGGDGRDYLGDDRVPGPTIPVACVATTAGTGSEVTGAAAFTDTDNRVKVGCLSNFIRPMLAVVDPALTVSCPRKVTADSGIDALTHAVEAWTAVDNAAFPLPAGERSVYQGRQPLGDLTAGEAIRLCGRYLRRAVSDGHDWEAREGMALAATLAGLAFSNVGVALVHAMEYPVGGATGCSHGEGNGLLLPHVMKFNMPERMAETAKVAAWLGCDTRGMSDHEAAEVAIEAVHQLNADIGIPRRLRDLGVTPEQLPGFAAKAFAIKRILRVNPRAATPADITAIYEQAW